MSSQTTKRNKALKVRSNERDGTRFLALPDCVLDSPAWLALSHPARSLLIDVARQIVGDNNGQLLASMAHLAKRGWTSADTVTRAKKELLAAGFLFETVKGQRPNKASWFAVTWRRLDRHHGYDAGAPESFVRSAYLKQQSGPTVGPIPADGTGKNTPLRPSAGAGMRCIAPSRGTVAPPTAPPAGAVGAVDGRSPIPRDGNHLENPSAAATRLIAVRDATKEGVLL